VDSRRQEYNIEYRCIFRRQSRAEKVARADRARKLIPRTAYRSARARHWRRGGSPLREIRFIFVRCTFVRLPAFYFAGSRHESLTRGPNANRGAQKNFAESTNGAETACGYAGRSRKGGEARRCALANDKKPREDAKGGPWCGSRGEAGEIAQKAQKAIRLSRRDAREDRDVTSNRGRERTSEGRVAGASRRASCEFGRNSLGFSADERGKPFDAVLSLSLCLDLAIAAGRDAKSRG